MDPFSLLLLGGLALLLVWQFSRVRKQQAAVRETRQGLVEGAEVLTAAGMLATVVSVQDTTVTLRGEDGNLTRWLTQAVVRVVPDSDPASSRYRPPATDDQAPPTEAVDDDGTPRHQD